MRTILLSLEEAIKTGLKNAEDLEKGDKIIFFYPKGEDTISLEVHTRLTQIKAKVEFKSVPDKENMFLYTVFMAGYLSTASNTVYIISDNTGSFEIEEGMNTYIVPNIASVFKKTNTVAKTVTKRKPRESKKTVAPVETKETFQEELDASEVKEDVEEVQMSLELEASVHEPVQNEPEKKRGRKKEELSINDFKEYLGQYETDSFAPQDYAMTIFDSIKKAITNNLPVEKCVLDGMLLEDLKEKARETFKGHYDDIMKIAKKVKNF